jgi:hypothetical protein
MGKSKRTKTKRRAKNPTGLPSIRDIEREENELGCGEGDQKSKQEHAIQTLLEMVSFKVELYGSTVVGACGSIVVEALN